MTSKQKDGVRLDRLDGGEGLDVQDLISNVHRAELPPGLRSDLLSALEELVSLRESAPCECETDE